MPAHPAWIDTRKPPALALRALLDCRVLRASNQHPGLMRLFVDCYADMRPEPYSRGTFRFTLTDAGRELAKSLKPWGATS